MGASKEVEARNNARTRRVRLLFQVIWFALVLLAGIFFTLLLKASLAQAGSAGQTKSFAARSNHAAWLPLAVLCAGLLAVCVIVWFARKRDGVDELSTPVFQVSERLSVVPIVGPLDETKARSVTAQVARSIRKHGLKTVTLDMSAADAGPGALDRLIETAEAARLLGAEVLLTGVTHETLLELAAVLDGARDRDLNTEKTEEARQNLAIPHAA